ncbi:hypothetical protein ACVBEG_15850 [Pseudomonas sp. GG8]
MSANPISLPPITTYDALLEEIRKLKDSAVIDPLPATEIAGAITAYAEDHPEYKSDELISHLREQFLGGGPVLQDAGMTLALGICIGVMLRSRF